MGLSACEERSRQTRHFTVLKKDRIMSGWGDSRGGGPPMRMEVPNSYVGRIIGRGGSRIRELQDESGARINIMKNEATSDSTPVELIGAEECQNHARELIEGILNEQQSYGRGGGGDRYGGGGGGGRYGGGGGGYGGGG